MSPSSRGPHHVILGLAVLGALGLGLISLDPAVCRQVGLCLSSMSSRRDSASAQALARAQKAASAQAQSQAQAQAIDPRDAYAYITRGNAKYGLGDKQGAIADYNQALSIDPRHATTYYNRGIAKEQLNDLSGACQDWRQAAQLGDQDAAQWVAKQCR